MIRASRKKSQRNVEQSRRHSHLRGSTGARNNGQPSSSSALSSLSIGSGGQRAVHGGRHDAHASHSQVIASSSMSLPSPRRMMTSHSSHYGAATTSSASAEPASCRRQYSGYMVTPSHMDDHVSSISPSPSRQHEMLPLEHRQEQQQQQQRHHFNPEEMSTTMMMMKKSNVIPTSSSPSHLQQHHLHHQHRLQQYRRQRHTPLYSPTTTSTTTTTSTCTMLTTAHAAYHTIPYTLTRRGAQQQPPVYHLHSTDHPHSIRMIGIPITYRFPMELLPSLEFISTHGQQRVSHLSRDECWIVDMTPKALQTPNIIIHTKDGHYVALDVAMTMCVSDAVTFIGLGDEYVDHLTLACERAAQLVGESSTHRDVVDPQYHSFYTAQIHDYLQQLCEGMGVDVLHVQFTARPYTMTHVTAQLRLLDDLATRGEHVLGGGNGSRSGSEGRSGRGSDVGDTGRDSRYQHDDNDASHTHHVNHHNSNHSDNTNTNTSHQSSSSPTPPSSSSPPRLLASYRIKSHATTSSPSSPSSSSSSSSTSAGSSSRTSTIKCSKSTPSTLLRQTQNRRHFSTISPSPHIHPASYTRLSPMSHQPPNYSSAFRASLPAHGVPRLFVLSSLAGTVFLLKALTADATNPEEAKRQATGGGPGDGKAAGKQYDAFDLTPRVQEEFSKEDMSMGIKQKNEADIDDDIDFSHLPKDPTFDLETQQRQVQNIVAELGDVLNTTPRFQEEMTRDEAIGILGLDTNASKEEIMDKYRGLIRINHPDAGGSAYIANKINEAKTLIYKDAPSDPAYKQRQEEKKRGEEKIRKQQEDARLVERLSAIRRRREMLEFRKNYDFGNRDYKVVEEQASKRIHDIDYGILQMNKGEWPSITFKGWKPRVFSTHEEWQRQLEYKAIEKYSKIKQAEAELAQFEAEQEEQYKKLREEQREHRLKEKLQAMRSGVEPESEKLDRLGTGPEYHKEYLGKHKHSEDFGAQPYGMYNRGPTY